MVLLGVDLAVLLAAFGRREIDALHAGGWRGAGGNDQGGGHVDEPGRRLGGVEGGPFATALLLPHSEVLFHTMSAASPAATTRLTAQGVFLERLGITGFCWGGRVTWLYAAHNKRLKAGVAWYGQLVGEPSALKPTNPVDVVGSLHAPVLGLYGGKDTGITQELVAKMKAALETMTRRKSLMTMKLMKTTRVKGRVMTHLLPRP